MSICYHTWLIASVNSAFTYHARAFLREDDNIELQRSIVSFMQFANRSIEKVNQLYEESPRFIEKLCEFFMSPCFVPADPVASFTNFIEPDNDPQYFVRVYEYLVSDEFVPISTENHLFQFGSFMLRTSLVLSETTQHESESDDDDDCVVSDSVTNKRRRSDEPTKKRRGRPRKQVDVVVLEKEAKLSYGLVHPIQSRHVVKSKDRYQAARKLASVAYREVYKQSNQTEFDIVISEKISGSLSAYSVAIHTENTLYARNGRPMASAFKPAIVSMRNTKPGRELIDAVLKSWQHV